MDQFMLLSLIMVEGNVCVFVNFRFFLYYKNYVILSNLSNKSNVIILTFFFSDTMDVDTDAKKYNKKTKLDEHGNYPVWMNSRQIKKQKKKNKVQKNKRAGKGGTKKK